MIHKKRTDPPPKYISRTKAAELLKISKKDFHELAILTNTKPVQPKNKQKYDHEDVLFYRIDDIQKIIDNDAFDSLKTKKWVQNKRAEHIKNLRFEKAKNLYNVEHNYVKLIQAKYSTFKDSVIGLSESLDVLFMIMTFFPILIEYSDFKTVINEWKTFIMDRKILKNIFINKKGYYFLAELNKIEVIWLEPFPSEEDLDPKKYETDDISVIYKLAYFHLKFTMKKLSTQKLEMKTNNKLFDGKRFYLHVFNSQIVYLIEYLGGRIEENLEYFDYYITDYEIQDFDTKNIYLQPQYIFDCFNKQIKLPHENYIVGKCLPEHVCPFHKNECLKFDERMFALMSKTKQRKLNTFLKETKY